MSKPIEFTPRLVTLAEQLDAATLESAQALQQSLNLLRELHEHGMLELMIKLVRGGEGLSEGTLKTLSSDQALPGIRTVIELAYVLGNLQPTDIRQFAQGISGAAGQGALNAVHGVKVAPLDIPKHLLNSNVQTALGATFGILKGLGVGLREANEERGGNRS